MQKYIILATLFVTFSIGNVDAQERKNQKNFLNEQLSAQLLNNTLALSDPKLVKAQAELLRLHYNALVEAGFTKSEALQIVVAKSYQQKK
jgi:hypothetical protein